MRKRRVALVFGTRPEAIKLCPLFLAMKESNFLEPLICVSGQHREMVGGVLSIFDVPPDIDLQVMKTNQTLAELSSRVLLGVDGFLEKSGPNLVVVQGDTTTALFGAVAAFYRGIPVAHVEAGLRTGTMAAPFPEEMNRVVISRLARLHYAPTRNAADALLREGIPSETVRITGNTVIDAVRIAVAKTREFVPPIPGLEEHLLASPRRVVLITGHRRESFGSGLRGICSAVRDLAAALPDVAFVYPVHPNPSVKVPVYKLLSEIQNVFLIEPLEYLPFVRLMDRSTIILTDSGGVQEEAPTLSKPVLVMRDQTERTEAVDSGVARLVGTDPRRIFEQARLLLTDPSALSEMTRGENPYGDGYASNRILAHLTEWFQSGASATIGEAPGDCAE